MSYRITYAEGTATRTVLRAEKKWMLAVLVAMACLLLAYFGFTGDPPPVASLLFPGAAEEATAAAEELLDHIRQGRSVSEAVTTFCRSILAHAG